MRNKKTQARHTPARMTFLSMARNHTPIFKGLIQNTRAATLAFACILPLTLLTTSCFDDSNNPNGNKRANTYGLNNSNGVQNPLTGNTRPSTTPPKPGTKINAASTAEESRPFRLSNNNKNTLSGLSGNQIGGGIATGIPVILNQDNPKEICEGAIKIYKEYSLILKALNNESGPNPNTELKSFDGGLIGAGTATYSQIKSFYNSDKGKDDKEGFLSYYQDFLGRSPLSHRYKSFFENGNSTRASHNYTSSDNDGDSIPYWCEEWILSTYYGVGEGMDALNDRSAVHPHRYNGALVMAVQMTKKDLGKIKWTSGQKSVESGSEVLVAGQKSTRFAKAFYKKLNKLLPENDVEINLIDALRRLMFSLGPDDQPVKKNHLELHEVELPLTKVFSSMGSGEANSKSALYYNADFASTDGAKYTSVSKRAYGQNLDDARVYKHKLEAEEELLRKKARKALKAGKSPDDDLDERVSVLSRKVHEFDQSILAYKDDYQNSTIDPGAEYFDYDYMLFSEVNRRRQINIHETSRNFFEKSVPKFFRTFQQDKSKQKHRRVREVAQNNTQKSSNYSTLDYIGAFHAQGPMVTQQATRYVPLSKHGGLSAAIENQTSDKQAPIIYSYHIPVLSEREVAIGKLVNKELTLGFEGGSYMVFVDGILRAAKNVSLKTDEGKAMLEESKAVLKPRDQCLTTNVIIFFIPDLLKNKKADLVAFANSLFVSNADDQGKKYYTSLQSGISTLFPVHKFDQDGGLTSGRECKDYFFTRDVLGLPSVTDVKSNPMEQAAYFGHTLLSYSGYEKDKNTGMLKLAVGFSGADEFFNPQGMTLQINGKDLGKLFSMADERGNIMFSQENKQYFIYLSESDLSPFTNDTTVEIGSMMVKADPADLTKEHYQWLSNGRPIKVSNN